MVRNQAGFAYSSHSHNLFPREEEIADFEGAFATEDDQRAGRQWRASKGLTGGLLYGEIAMLAEQPARYRAVFDPSQIHVALHDLRVNSCAEISQTFSYLVINPEVPVKLAVVVANKTAFSQRVLAFTQTPHPMLESVYRRMTPRRARRRFTPAVARLNADQRAREPMAADLRRHLWSRFEPDVQRLEVLIGRHLSSWAPTDTAN